jgi:hypothetical protein
VQIVIGSHNPSILVQRAQHVSGFAPDKHTIVLLLYLIYQGECRDALLPKEALSMPCIYVYDKMTKVTGALGK